MPASEPSRTTDRTVFVHIGTRKSGSTFLQTALRESRAQLAAQGAALVGTTRELGEVVGALVGQRPRTREEKLAGLDLLLGLLDPSVPRQIISLEALAEQPDWVASHLLEGIRQRGYAVSVLVTARHWGKVVPSEWQQRVKQRGVVGYADFVADVRAGGPGQEGFWARHFLPDVVTRWGAPVGLDSVRVIATPSPSTPGPGITELFCGAVGIDSDQLEQPAEELNVSLSLEQAEMLRRLNVALGDRMPQPGGAYGIGVRGWVTQGSLMKHPQPSVRLPADAVPWCVEVTARQLAELGDLGVAVVGDPDDLLCPADLASGPVEASDADVADVAVATIADLASLRWERVGQQLADRRQKRKGS